MRGTFYHYGWWTIAAIICEVWINRQPSSHQSRFIMMTNIAEQSHHSTPFTHSHWGLRRTYSIFTVHNNVGFCRRRHTTAARKGYAGMRDIVAMNNKHGLHPPYEWYWFQRCIVTAQLFLKRKVLHSLSKCKISVPIIFLLSSACPVSAHHSEHNLCGAETFEYSERRSPLPLWHIQHTAHKTGFNVSPIIHNRCYTT